MTTKPRAPVPDEQPTEADADGDDAAALPTSVYLVCNDAQGLRVRPLAEGQSVVVGRGAEAELRVESTRVSRRHARLTLRGGALVVEDLGSRNGTRVGNQLLRSASREVGSGSTIAVGPLEIVAARATAPLDDSAHPGEQPASPEGIIVADKAMVRLFAVVRRLAATTSAVLVVGETGAGKEVVAEQIHRLGPRADGPLVRLNCASIPENLLESELFGHERGAFTGADRRRVGHVQAAHGGTLLLDEIGEMPAALQAKLLRVLERRAITPVGASTEIAVDVRFLCATHRDLRREVAEGRFRQDLYYRVSTFTVEVPPLRERPAEILLLADLFARRLAHEAHVAPKGFTPDALATLRSHRWPGNVRELRNAIEHAMVMADGAPIARAHLPAEVRGDVAGGDEPMREKLSEVERLSIEAALAAEGGNQTRAAKRLGISRRALIYKIDKHGLRKP